MSILPPLSKKKLREAMGRPVSKKHDSLSGVYGYVSVHASSLPLSIDDPYRAGERTAQYLKSLEEEDVDALLPGVEFPPLSEEPASSNGGRRNGHRRRQRHLRHL